MALKASEEARCFTCTIVDEYVGLANEFSQDLSQLLFPYMQILFLSLVSLWIVIQGIRLMTTQTTLGDFVKELMYVMIAAVLLGGQGPEFVHSIFTVTLQMMGAAASLALQVGNPGAVANVDYTSIGGGLHALMFVAETAIMDILRIGYIIALSWTILDPMMILLALILIVPYFILWIVYFSQVVVSIFRIMILATLSPFMILGFAFSWGRDMLKGGMRALISSFIVLFASTAVISVLLYAVTKLGINELHGQSARDIASVTNVQFMLTVAMGWLGTAFMTEATGLANSITGSNFTNNAAGTIVAGAVGTALAVAKSPGMDGLKGATGSAVGGAAYLAGAGVGAGINQAARVAELIAKTKKSGGS